jgi:GcrA cell cycle regulator
MSWTEERVDLAKQLWREGISASQIALKVSGKDKTFTRNAVIEKMLQLKRAERASAPRRRMSKPTMRSRLADIQAKSLPPINQTPLVTDIMSLKNHHCRWPIGDPQDDGFGYCGATKHAPFSYCEHHARIAYAPPQAMKERAHFPTGLLHRKLKAA